MMMSGSALHAAIQRQGWVLQQLSEAPSPGDAFSKRHQVKLDVVQLEDVFSLQAQGVIDFGLLEMKLSASERLFLDVVDTPSPNSQSLAGVQHGLGIELARFGLTANQHYGRLGVGYFKLFPSLQDAWFRFAIDTGVLDSPEFPWRFDFHFSLYLPTYKVSKAQSFVFKTRTLKRLGGSDHFYWGGQLEFVKSIFPETTPKGILEDLNISFGPLFMSKTSWGDVSFGALWRLHIDKDTELSGGDRQVHPSEIRPIPDLILSWSVVW